MSEEDTIFEQYSKRDGWNLDLHEPCTIRKESHLAAVTKMQTLVQSRTIFRTVGQSSSFGANPVEQHIGLGHHAVIDSIDIFWPTSKTRQHFENVAVGQYLQIKEFASIYLK
jgi:hypothetical protein